MGSYACAYCRVLGGGVFLNARYPCAGGSHVAGARRRAPHYRVTSLIRKSPSQDPTVGLSRGKWWSQGGGAASYEQGAPVAFKSRSWRGVVVACGGRLTVGGWHQAGAFLFWLTFVGWVQEHPAVVACGVWWLVVGGWLVFIWCLVGVCVADCWLGAGAPAGDAERPSRPHQGSLRQGG